MRRGFDGEEGACVRRLLASAVGLSADPITAKLESLVYLATGLVPFHTLQEYVCCHRPCFKSDKMLPVLLGLAKTPAIDSALALCCDSLLCDGPEI